MNKNVETLKDEFNKDGQILESAFRFELIFKKHKKLIITLGVLIIAAIVYFIALSIYQDIKQKRAYEAYSSLLELQNLSSSDDEYESKKAQLLIEIKDNNKLLYDFYLYGASSDLADFQELAKSKNEFISELAAYNVLQMQIDEFLVQNDGNLANLSDEKKVQLHNLIQDLDSVKNPHLAQWVLLQQAVLLLSIGQIQQAKQKAVLVSQDNPNLLVFANIVKSYK